jgi:hypothetical protein
MYLQQGREMKKGHANACNPDNHHPLLTPSPVRTAYGCSKSCLEGKVEVGGKGEIQKTKEDP